MLRELAFQVLEVYNVVDMAVAGFAVRTEFRCPEACGACCRSEKVEATVLECLPLAFELFYTLQAELILKRLEKNNDEKQCVLYRPDYTAAGLWGCTQYRYRAVVCRMFGFAGNRDRQGKVRLAMCRVMKQEGGVDDDGIDLDDREAPLPLFMDAGLRITALHPGLGTVRMPINMALREALQKVGILLELSGATTSGKPFDHQQPPTKPLLPHSPPGRQAA